MKSCKDYLQQNNGIKPFKISTRHTNYHLGTLKKIHLTGHEAAYWGSHKTGKSTDYVARQSR